MHMKTIILHIGRDPEHIYRFRYALDLAKRKGVVSILDAGPAQPLSPTLIGKADIISPNETAATTHQQV